MNADDAERRIRELEEELARQRAETARYREAAYAFSRIGPFPDDDPPTEGGQLVFRRGSSGPLFVEYAF